MHTPDLRAELRWPRYAPKAAAELRVRSVLVYRLHTDGRTLGALNLFSTHPDAFDATSQEIGLIVAAHAAVAYRWAQTEQQLSAAIETRQCIGQAVGIIVERLKITPEVAFDRLAQASQDHNIRLAMLAEQIVTTGELPPLRDDR